MGAIEAPVSAGIILPPRWTPMRLFRTQRQYWRSMHRFNTVPAGRRSGKTELAKRKLVKKALYATTPWAPRFFAGAPTRDQAKRIFWEDLKAMTPKNLIIAKSESDLWIRYINYAEIWVLGLDVPERVEGSPWDGCVLDEIANTDPDAWPKHIRPALADRNGWADLIGVPEGRNHYYELDKAARARMKSLGDASDWGAFHWTSEDVLPLYGRESELEAARRDLDEMTYDQEYRASFLNFSGRAYYPFDERTHCGTLKYRKDAPLDLTFDFNVEPGTAAISQEQTLPSGEEGTAVIGEVFIPRNSSTEAVCRAILKNKDGSPTKWSKHTGPVRCYGDATGGARGSAKVTGSDWDIIWRELKPAFGDELDFRVKKKNPPERSRINAMNTRLRARDGRIRLMVDGMACPWMVKDLEGTVLLEGGSGEIDKKKTPMLTHLTDGLGYKVEYEFPIIPQTFDKMEIGGY